MKREDFSEVGHTGGKVTFTIKCDADSKISYSIGYSLSSTNPASLCGVYAHPEGFVCANIVMGGIGDPWNTPPFPNCIAILMASDSQGRFGHECPKCNKYFRSDNIPARHLLTCPYCGLRNESFHFITPPQLSYIRHYIKCLEEGLDDANPNSNSEIVIDMDSVADSVTNEPRPDFYYSSISQQTEFMCSKCNSYNDIRGRYGYCSACGWRNNAEFLRKSLEDLRGKLNSSTTNPEDGVKQAVSEFDSAARNYVEQLVQCVPMLDSRKNQLSALLFHNLEKFETLVQECFGIKMLSGMEPDRSFVKMMFSRRHIYEHDGGVATERYIRGSGDAGVEQGTLVRETLENAQQLIGYLNKMFENFEKGFHEIFPPELFCIEIEEQRKARTRESKGPGSNSRD